MRRSYRKLTLALALGVGVLVLLHATPLRTLGTSLQFWKDRIHEAGPWAAAGFFLASSLLVAVGVPRLLMAGLSGVLFGVVSGLLLAYGSALIGSYGLFLFARWGGREWVQRKFPLTPRMRVLLYHPTWLSVLLFRQLPVAGLVQNMVLGVTSVTHRAFWAGTAVGILPSTVLMVLFAGGVGKADWKESLVLASAALGIAGLLSILLLRRAAGKGGGGEA